MLGEASTTEIARNTDAQGFLENKIVAKKGIQLQEMLEKHLN